MGKERKEGEAGGEGKRRGEVVWRLWKWIDAVLLHLPPLLQRL